MRKVIFIMLMFPMVLLSCFSSYEENIDIVNNPALVEKVNTLDLELGQMEVDFLGETYKYKINDSNFCFRGLNESLRYKGISLGLETPSGSDLSLIYGRSTFSDKNGFYFYEGVAIVDLTHSGYINIQSDKTEFGYVEDDINNEVCAIVKGSVYKRSEFDEELNNSEQSYPFEIRINSEY